jgi:hypothetical protein
MGDNCERFEWTKQVSRRLLKHACPACFFILQPRAHVLWKSRRRHAQTCDFWPPRPARHCQRPSARGPRRGDAIRYYRPGPIWGAAVLVWGAMRPNWSAVSDKLVLVDVVGHRPRTEYFRLGVLVVATPRCRPICRSEPRTGTFHTKKSQRKPSAASTPPQGLDQPGGAKSIQLAARSLEGIRAAQTILEVRFVRSPTVRHRTKFPVYTNPAMGSNGDRQSAERQTPARTPARSRRWVSQRGVASPGQTTPKQCGRHVARLIFYRAR